MEKNQNEKRVVAGFAAFVVLAALLTVRLWQIQIVSHDEFSEAAAVQQYIYVEGLDTRGRIFDRNMESITGGNYKYYCIINRERKEDTALMLLESLGAEEVSRENKRYNVYELDFLDDDAALMLKESCGAYIFRCRDRYSAVQPACHLIGYLSEWNKQGISGMELLFEDVLVADDVKLALTSDAAGNIISGIRPVTISGKDGQAAEADSVITSLDIKLQKKCESLLTGSAACIVADCFTGEILAMASSPSFEPDKIENYLDQESDCLINKALQASYPPGSVFKLVTAAAALENDICLPEKEFECRGEATVNGVTVKCSTAPEGGHGRLDMYRAMACSCNCYFVQLGELTGYEKILGMADRFGIGSKVFGGFPEENCGRLPGIAETSCEDISNISIGQGQILITPLQAARLTGIIGGGGVYNEMTLLKKDSEVSDAFAALGSDGQEPQRVISEKTAAALLTMMRMVMTEGTGRSASFAMPIAVYGKSGTAEASSKGRKVKDCWFTGFYTMGQQCISVTVFVEDGVSGARDALPVFTEIVNYFSSR